MLVMANFQHFIFVNLDESLEKFFYFFFAKFSIFQTLLS